jgi:hypothetical protein
MAKFKIQEGLEFADGTSMTTAATGSASTGDITFDGVKIKGAGTASGDGLGYATMELVPDNSLYSSGQYLIIDPTGPNHIHIRAGGLIDQSQSELILGGEKLRVRVYEADGNAGVFNTQEVNLRYNSYNAGTADFGTATYTDDGTTKTITMTTVSQAVLDDIIASNNISFLYAYTGAVSYTFKFQGSSNTPGAGQNANFTVLPNNPGDTLPADGTTFTQVSFDLQTTRTTRLEIAGSDVNIEAADDVRIYSRDTFLLANYGTTDSIRISTQHNTANQKDWYFNSDGNFQLPAGGDIIDSTGTSVLGGGGGSSGPTTVEISSTPPTTPVVGQVYYDSDDGNIYICTATTPSVTWVDSSPTGGVLGDAGISLDGGTGTNYWKPTTADGTGTINKAGAYKTANDANNSLFTFGANGAGTMSVQIEGSMFVGATLPNNNGGLNTDYAGWLVVESGAKFGGTINTLGSLQFDTAGLGVNFQDGTTMVSANDSFGTKTGATGVVVHDAVSTSMWVHSSISANFTANFTNLTLAAGTATNITLVLNQGATAYICNAIQIGGVAQTIKWQGSSSAPTGNSNKTDVMSFSIFNVSGTYTVLGQLVSFG